jgi:hypothetical protein
MIGFVGHVAAENQGTEQSLHLRTDNQGAVQGSPFTRGQSFRIAF